MVEERSGLGEPRVELSDTRFEVCGRCTRLPHGWLRCLHEWKQTKLFLIDGTPGGLTTRTSPTGQATSYPRVVRTLGSS